MAKIVVRRAGLATEKARLGLGTDEQVARAAGIHPTQYSRVLSGRSEPGNKFIAGVLEVFGVDAFSRIFAIVSDDDGDEA